MNCRSIAAAALALAALAAPALAQTSDTQQQQQFNTIRQLHWHNTGTYQLPISQSVLAIPSGYVVTFGEDARKAEIIAGNPYDRTTEAVAINRQNDTIVFQAINDGYVTTSDWRNVDPNTMIREISNNTEAANEDRIKRGVPELHVKGWLQQPTFDQQTSTVFWAIDATSGSESNVNSIALRLSRTGYERINWITDRASYVPFGGPLDVMLRAQSFDPGNRYSDYVSGDKIAAYTIAGLVAAVAGAKALQVVAGVGLLVLLKKFGILIFAAIAVGLAKLKGAFRRKTGPGAPTA